MAITMRAGLWDAASSYSWLRACRERDALFLATKQTESLFYRSCPTDIDEFSLLIVELSFRVERVERWHGEAKMRDDVLFEQLETWYDPPLSRV